MACIEAKSLQLEIRIRIERLTGPNRILLDLVIELRCSGSMRHSTFSGHQAEP